MRLLLLAPLAVATLLLTPLLRVAIHGTVLARATDATIMHFRRVVVASWSLTRVLASTTSKSLADLGPLLRVRAPPAGFVGFGCLGIFGMSSGLLVGGGIAGSTCEPDGKWLSPDGATAASPST